MIPTIIQMDVYPVAGHDSMELNLSGAHAPFFTRNIVVLKDSSGNLGVGEVPGGQKITKALEEVKAGHRQPHLRLQGHAQPCARMAERKHSR